MLNRKDIPDDGGVYILRCKIINSMYVGKCTLFKDRVWKEILALRRFEKVNEYNNVIAKSLQDEFKKYGEESFEISYITINDEEFADVIEFYLIKKYNAVEDGYNGNNRRIKMIFEKNKNRHSYSFKSRIRNEEETLLYNELKKIFRYDLEEYISYNQLSNEMKAIYNYDLQESQLLKIISAMDFNIYLKSIVNDFYYKISSEEFKKLLLCKSQLYNLILKDDYVEHGTNIIENTMIGCYPFSDKDNYIKQVSKYNKRYIDYIKGCKDNLDHLKEKHYRQLRRHYHDCNDYSMTPDKRVIFHELQEIKEEIQNNSSNLEIAKSRIIIPRYIVNENGTVIDNPDGIKNIKYVDS